MAFGMRVEESGQVGAATLKRSTVADRGVEACMAGALRGIPLPMRELMAQATSEGRKHAPSPELGGLFDDDTQVALQMLPVALTVAGGVIIVVLVLWASHEVIEAILAPSGATAAAPPRAAAGAKARKYPNQTCEDEELKALEKEKSRLCESGFAADCSGSRLNPKVAERWDTTPCSAILKSIDQRNDCLTQRNLVEEKCFGGKPDPGHAEQIEKVKQGIRRCEELKQINCAEGHPMSGL